MLTNVPLALICMVVFVVIFPTRVAALNTYAVQMLAEIISLFL